MICIEPHGNDFRVKVSDSGFGRYSVRAHDLDEAIQAIRHYFAKPYHPCNAVENCPLCRKGRAQP